MSNVLLAVLLMSGIGVALIVLGLLAHARKGQFVKTGLRTSGVVTALVPRMGLNDPDQAQTTYAPSVEFMTHAGEKCSFTSAVASSHPGYRIGQKVVVVYAPHHPSKAIILSFSEVWFVPLILWGLGVLFVLIGILVAFGLL